MTICLKVTFLSILLIYLQYLQILKGDDLPESPIFDVRPESISLQEIQTQLDLLKAKQQSGTTETSPKDPNLKRIKTILSKFLGTLKRDKRKTKLEKAQKSHKPKFHKWTEWSTCSVTCGKGRVIRWRHCKENCKEIETEMEEMSCQLPECPRKLFGIIKLMP